MSFFDPKVIKDRYKQLSKAANETKKKIHNIQMGTPTYSREDYERYKKILFTSTKNPKSSAKENVPVNNEPAKRKDLPKSDEVKDVGIREPHTTKATENKRDSDKRYLSEHKSSPQGVDMRAILEDLNAPPLSVSRMMEEEDVESGFLQSNQKSIASEQEFQTSPSPTKQSGTKYTSNQEFELSFSSDPRSNSKQFFITPSAEYETRRSPQRDYKPTILIHDYHSPPLESSFGNSTAKKEFGDTRDEHMSPQAFSVEDQEEREQLSEDFVRLLEERKRLEEELLNLDKMRNITKINTLLKQKDLEPNNRHLLDNYSTAVDLSDSVHFDSTKRMYLMKLEGFTPSQSTIIDQTDGTIEQEAEEDTYGEYESTSLQQNESLEEYANYTIERLKKEEPWKRGCLDFSSPKSSSRFEQTLCKRSPKVSRDLIDRLSEDIENFTKATTRRNVLVQSPGHNSSQRSNEIETPEFKRDRRSTTSQDQQETGRKYFCNPIEEEESYDEVY